MKQVFKARGASFCFTTAGFHNTSNSDCRFDCNVRVDLKHMTNALHLCYAANVKVILTCLSQVQKRWMPVAGRSRLRVPWGSRWTEMMMVLPTHVKWTMWPWRPPLNRPQRCWRSTVSTRAQIHIPYFLGMLMQFLTKNRIVYLFTIYCIIFNHLNLQDTFQFRLVLFEISIMSLIY